MHIMMTDIYRQIYNTSRTLVGNKPVDHSDVVGASPAILQWIGQRNCSARREYLSFEIWCPLY